MNDAIIHQLQAAAEVDPVRSRIRIAGYEVAYQCARFSTRIIRGLEDVLGVEEANALIQQAAAESLYKPLAQRLEAQPGWASMPRQERLALIFSIFKMLGYGAMDIAETNGNRTRVTSANSYLAEGFFENAEQWRWSKRSAPFCHDMCGYLRAAFAVSDGVPLDQVIVKEIACRTMGAELCIFDVEVIR
ncbi:MAG: hypothetical protein ACUVSB_07275 [Anaerolineae bacterium]